MGDALTDGGDRPVGEHDQAEVVHCDPGVGSAARHGGGVAGVCIDHDDLDRIVERGTALQQPCPGRIAGPAVALSQQRLVADRIDEPGLPRITVLPPDWARSTTALGQPP